MKSLLTQAENPKHTSYRPIFPEALRTVAQEEMSWLEQWLTSALRLQTLQLKLILTFISSSLLVK